MRHQLRLTFRTFTKPRSRATPGGGVSTPTEICYFHGLRGKRATRALREMLLLSAVDSAVRDGYLLRQSPFVDIDKLHIVLIERDAGEVPVGDAHHAESGWEL